MHSTIQIWTSFGEVFNIQCHEFPVMVFSSEEEKRINLHKDLWRFIQTESMNFPNLFFAAADHFDLEMQKWMKKKLSEPKKNK